MTAELGKHSKRNVHETHISPAVMTKIGHAAPHCPGTNATTAKLEPVGLSPSENVSKPRSHRRSYSSHGSLTRGDLVVLPGTSEAEFTPPQAELGQQERHVLSYAITTRRLFRVPFGSGDQSQERARLKKGKPRVEQSGFGGATYGSHHQVHARNHRSQSCHARPSTGRC